MMAWERCLRLAPATRRFLLFLRVCKRAEGESAKAVQAVESISLSIWRRDLMSISMFANGDGSFLIALINAVCTTRAKPDLNRQRRAMCHKSFWPVCYTGFAHALY